MRNPGQHPAAIPIAIVERDTGIPKDTLRIWERRYGFPNPGRDANGERHYTQDEVDKLRALKRLMDQGVRPGKIMALPLSDLLQMAQSVPTRVVSEDEHRVSSTTRDLLLQHKVVELRLYLQRLMLQQGVYVFISQTVARLNQHIGEMWARGELSVAHEHLFTETLQNILRGLIHSQPQGSGRPRILLCTLPGETHLLGLLMAEMLWSAEGAECVSLGGQFPLADIPSVVAEGHYDVVALSFSSNFPSLQALAALRSLRGLLPAAVEIWAGGGALGPRQRIEGVRIGAQVGTTVDFLNDWRLRHA